MTCNRPISRNATAHSLERRTPGCWKICRVRLSYLQERILAAPPSPFGSVSRSMPASHPGKRALLILIPGIGKLTAARLLAEIGDISAFKGSPQLAAYAGLNPKGINGHVGSQKDPYLQRRQSVLALHPPGCPRNRRPKHNPIIREFCQRLEERRLAKMAIVVAAMRKLLHLVFGV